MKRLLYYFLMLIALSTCTKVVNLSDNVELLDFKINGAIPSEVVFGKPVIKDRTVYINVVQGAAYLPVVIGVEPIISGNTEQAITGKDFSSFSNIRFDFDDADLGLTKTFYLVAKSGLPVPYTIELSLDAIKSRVHSISVNAAENTFIAPEGYINPIKKTIKLYTLDESFSDIELKSSLIISENSKLKSLDGKALNVADVDLRFKNIKDTTQFVLEASNGEEDTWKVFITKAADYKGNENAEIKNVVSSIGTSPVSETEGVSIKNATVYEKNSTIVFSLENITRTNFKDIVISPNWKLSQYAMLAGINKDGILHFKNITDTINFSVIDRPSGVNRAWKAVIRENDVNDVNDFKFTFTDPKKYFKIDSINVDNAFGTIELLATEFTTLAAYWPVVITPKSINISKGANHDLDMASFNLANAKDEKKFTVTGYNGVKKDWTIKIVSAVEAYQSEYHTIGSIKQLESNIGLDKKDFIFPVSSVSNNTTTPYIHIDIPSEASFPIEISPHFNISSGAIMEGFRNGDFINFNSMKDEFPITVIAGNGNKQVWYIRLLRKAQPMNSDFEQWTKDNWIVSLPSPGRGWISANNSFVAPMTTPVRNTFDTTQGFAAQLETGVTASNAMGPKNLLTAGTLFLGRFKIAIMSLDNPKSMTKFGIPMTASPTAIEIDYKYEPGNKYQYSKLASGSGLTAVYQLTDLPGVDSGHIWVQLIHYSGAKELDYNGEWEGREDIKLLGRGEHICTKTGWNRLNMPIVRKEDFGKYKPTHVLVTMSSSIKGDFFTGAIGSRLTVDNFEFIYE